MATLYKRPECDIWQARIKVGDRWKRISTGERDPRKAQKEADRREEEENATLFHSTDLRLVEASARFFTEKPLKKNTQLGYKVSLTNLVSVLGDFPLSTLTPKQIQSYIQIRTKGSGVFVAVRRDLAFLSSLYATARHWDGGPQQSPLKDYDLKGLPTAKERNRWLTEAEVERLLAACQKDLHRSFITLAVETGMRRQELLGLCWEEIDLKRGIIVLGNLDDTRTKTGESRIIPLSDRARSTLLDTPVTHRHGLVLRSPRGGGQIVDLKKGWAGIIKRADLSGVRIHDLRHTFASWGKQRGIPETTLMAIMGHKTRSMVKRYSHDSLASLQAAMRSWDRDTVHDTGPHDWSSQEGRGVGIR